MTVINRIWAVIGLLVILILINTVSVYVQGSGAASHYIALVTAVLATLLGVASGIYLTRVITIPLNLIIENMRHTQEGELNASIKIIGDDEFSHVSREINDFTTKLNDILVGIDQHMHALLGHANHMTSTSLKSNLQAKNQQVSLAELLDLATKLAESVNDISRNAEVASSSASEANQLCNNGQQVISDSVDSVKDMADDINRSLSNINELQEDCQGVTLVLDVISGIADQTNLLALNAAIEAARAGEQGRGFAVVADEVRTLARKTQESTGKITKVIHSLQSRADSAVGYMTQVDEKSKEVVTKSDSALTALNQIAEKVAAITAMNQQIAATAAQQKQMSQTIHTNVRKVNELSANTVDQTRETQTTGQKTNLLAKSVQQDLEQFKLVGN